MSPRHCDFRTGLGPTLMDETNIAVIARLARNDAYARQSTARMMSSMVRPFCHHKMKPRK
jgi:hypothetical protein